MATQYLITRNGLDNGNKVHTNRQRAITEALNALFAVMDEPRGMFDEIDVVEVITVKTHKVVWTSVMEETVTESETEKITSVIAEANKITADKDAHTMRMSEFQALEDAYIREGVVTLSEVLTAQYAAEEALSVPVVGVIQDRPGMSGVTHYHTPGCRDIQREMKRYGQSVGDVLCMNFESIAEILIMEMGDVSSDGTNVSTPEWYASIVNNSNELIRIMPCLSIPDGMMGDMLLNVVKGEVFSLDYVAPVAPDECVRWVTKEYLLEIIVDESTGAAVDLGWHTFTVSEDSAANAEVIADMYGKINGSGQPRDGWASILRVIDICDI